MLQCRPAKSSAQVWHASLAHQRAAVAPPPPRCCVARQGAWDTPVARVAHARPVISQNVPAPPVARALRTLVHEVTTVITHGTIRFIRSFRTFGSIGTVLGRHEERVSMTFGWSNEMYTMLLGVG